jgi:hypothetical protein
MNTVAKFIIPIVMLIGFELYKKDDAHDDVREELTQVCEDDAACNNALNSYYETCFRKAYKTGGRRKIATFSMGSLLVCINESAGESIFGVERND